MRPFNVRPNRFKCLGVVTNGLDVDTAAHTDCLIGKATTAAGILVVANMNACRVVPL